VLSVAFRAALPVAFSFGLATLPRNLDSAFLAAVRASGEVCGVFEEEFEVDFWAISCFWLFSGDFRDFWDFWLSMSGLGCAGLFWAS